MCHFIFTPTKYSNAFSKKCTHIRIFIIFLFLSFFTFWFLQWKWFLHRYTFAQMQFKLFKQHILSVCLDQPSQIILFHLCIHYHSSDFIRTHDHHMMLKNCFRAFIEHIRFALSSQTFQQNTSSKLRLPQLHKKNHSLEVYVKIIHKQKFPFAVRILHISFQQLQIYFVFSTNAISDSKLTLWSFNGNWGKLTSSSDYL